MRFLPFLIALLAAGPAWADAFSSTPPPQPPNAVAITGGTISGTDVSGANVTSTGGTTARTEAAKASDALNVKDFGAKCDGSTDDSAAVSAALTAAVSTVGKIRFPAGTCIASNVSVSISSGASLTMEGSGSDVTILKSASGANGIAFTMGDMHSSFHVRDLTIASSGAVAGTIGISATLATAANPAAAAANDLTNVTLRGADGYAQTDFWDTGIYINGASNISYNNVNVLGNAAASAANCVHLFGTVAATSVVHNFFGGNYNYCAKGMFADAYTQGIVVSVVNFTGDQYGVYEPAGTGTTQLTVTNSQFNVSKDGVYDHGGVQDTFTGNLFIINAANAIGIDVLSGGGTLVSGNTFSGNNSAGSFGIQVEAPSYLSVTNNYFASINPFWFSAGWNYTTAISGNVYNTGVARAAYAAGATNIADYPQTFATLTPCVSGLEGQKAASVIDSTTATPGATITGGGTNHVSAYCNGTNWIVL